jgi:hypothetical protein
MAIYRLALAALLLAAATFAAPAVAASPDARSVTTETITAPPDTSDDAVPPDAPPDTNVAPGNDTSAPDDGTAAPAIESGGAQVMGLQPPPAVEYDFTKLPAPVAKLREEIIAAAETGDIEKLRPIVEGQAEPPDFGPSDTGDLVGYLKLQSGDSDGREILAILIEVLEAGYVHVDAGTPDEVYLWPYFARYPIDKLTPPQLVQLFKLVYAGDYQDMLANGVYDYFRAGISPDGQWRFFTAGD